MVVSAHPLASAAGLEILQAGGNAADAAVTVQLMLNLVEPQSSGIGGGSFMLYWDNNSQKLKTLDGRETAPIAVASDHFLDTDDKPLEFWQAVKGGHSVGVPGTLALLEQAQRDFGKLQWSRLLQPVITQAEMGFKVSTRLAKSIARAADKGLLDFPITSKFFTRRDGSLLQAGDLLKNRKFAMTLREIAQQGSTSFYHGKLAREIVATVTTSPINPGIMGLHDLDNYIVIDRDPICFHYRSFRICGMGPPSSGGVSVGQILGILQHYNLGTGPTADSVHLYLEAARLAYADRARYLADNDFVGLDVTAMLDPEYLRQRASLIKTDQSLGKAIAGDPFADKVTLGDDSTSKISGTSHFVIADTHGNLLSMTSSIETAFGSRLMVGGFLLNNELTDFSFVPVKENRPVLNRIQPGKRPRSSMAPTMVFAGLNPILLLGSPGGSRIINYVANTLIAFIDWQMPLQQAINLGHFVNRNGVTELEDQTPIASLASSLMRRGHEVKLHTLNSGIHAINIDDASHLIGGADPRREGVVAAD